MIRTPHSFRASLVVVALALAAGSAFAQTSPVWKVAFLNIQSGKGEGPLPGHTAPFVENENCTDPSQPMNAWGQGLLPHELQKRLAADPDTIAMGLAEAWLCGSPEHVRSALGWAAKTDNHNGVALVARYGFGGAVQWLQLDTSLNVTPKDTHWVVRAPVCADAACTRSVIVYSAHWYADGASELQTADTQARQTLAFMAQDAGHPHLLIGDLNRFESDVPGCGFAPTTSSALQQLRDAGYVDMWPRLHGTEEGYTGMQNRAHCGMPEGYTYKRIDRVFLSGYAPVAMERFGIMPPGDGTISDHLAIMATISDTVGSTVTDPAEVVLHATDASAIAGLWQLESDATAADGRRLRHADAGAPKVTTASATPANYFEMTFDAVAGIPYRIWFRGHADRNYYGNDSVFVQFSDSVTSAGTPTYRIGTTSATTLILEEGENAKMSGWGWQDNGYGYGYGVLGPQLYFAKPGSHTIRVQTREDGLAIDQIVLSSGRFLQAAPGAVRDDATILPR